MCVCVHNDMLYHRFCMTSCILEVREISYLCIHLNSATLYAMSLFLVDMAYTKSVSLYPGMCL